MKFVKSLALLAAVPMLALAQGKPTVAVLYFNNGAIGKNNAELQPLTKGTADLLIGELAANPNIRVIERDQIEKILQEQKLSTDGKVDGETAVKVGKLLGAHHLVTGGFITDPKGTIKFTTRVFSTETSQIEFPNPTSKDATVTGKIDNFMELVNGLAAKLNAGLKLPDMPAKVGEAKKEQAKKIPFEAVSLYSKALDAADAGKKQEAIALFKKSLDKFPQFEKAQQELAKLEK